MSCKPLSSVASISGTKLKDFVAAMHSDEQIQSKIANLRHEVEDYAKQFPTIGFEVETMKYGKWRWQRTSGVLLGNNNS